MKPLSQASGSPLKRHLTIKDSSRKKHSQDLEDPCLLKRHHSWTGPRQKPDRIAPNPLILLEPEADWDSSLAKDTGIVQKTNVRKITLKGSPTKQFYPSTNRLSPIRVTDTYHSHKSYLEPPLKTNTVLATRSFDSRQETIDTSDSFQRELGKETNSASLLGPGLNVNEFVATNNSLPLPSPSSFRRALKFRGSLQRTNNLASYVFNVVVLGQSKVGKTALVKQYISGEYPNHHVATAEDMYEKHLRRDKKAGDSSVYVLRIFDTAGTLSFPAMRKLTIKKGDAFILVYAINDAKSFEELKRLREEILSLKEEQSVPTVLIGNKADLPEAEWVVNSTAGLALAREWNCCFAEISAKNISSVEKIFQVIFRELEEQERRKGGSHRSLSLNDLREVSVLNGTRETTKCKVFCSIM